MNRLSRNQLGRVWALLGAVAAGPLPTSIARADAVSAVQVLREGGCGGILPAAEPLHRSSQLDRAAEQWAAGRTPTAAAERSGYQAESTTGLHINGPDSATVQLLRQSSCRAVTDRTLHDIGIYHHGADTWLLLAAAYVAPPRSQAPVLALQALQLVNEVRARGTRCGERSFGPAPPVRLSEALAGVALGHASDMAVHNYFEHEDLAGHSPADRVRAAGYHEKLVGENIAYGPASTEEVVRGWLESPGHCENIMDPRFAEMGIAFAAGQASKRGLYWVQVLADPQT